MSGFQEILVIVLIVLALFLVPRMRQPSRSSTPAAAEKGTAAPLLRGRTRLAIFVSLVWVGLAAAYFQPWRSQLVPFVYFGLGPVILGWGVLWVFKGFRKTGRSL